MSISLESIPDELINKLLEENNYDQSKVDSILASAHSDIQKICNLLQVHNKRHCPETLSVMNLYHRISFAIGMREYTETANRYTFQLLFLRTYLKHPQHEQEDKKADMEAYLRQLLSHG